MSDPTDKVERAIKRYLSSDKGKRAQRRYLDSEKGRQALQKYRNSTKGKIAALKYYQSEKGRQTRERRKQVNRLIIECETYLEENPDKTIKDFLKEKENG